jgi:hypothetical protein
LGINSTFVAVLSRNCSLGGYPFNTEDSFFTTLDAGAIHYTIILKINNKTADTPHTLAASVTGRGNVFPPS